MTPPPYVPPPSPPGMVTYRHPSRIDRAFGWVVLAGLIAVIVVFGCELVVIGLASVVR